MSVYKDHTHIHTHVHFLSLVTRETGWLEDVGSVGTEVTSTPSYLSHDMTVVFRTRNRTETTRRRSVSESAYETKGFRLEG